MVVGVASTLSLIFFIVIAAKNQPESFFLLPSRLWELGLGSFLLFSVTTPGSLTLRLGQIMPPSLLLTVLVGLLFLRTDAGVPTTIAVAGLSALLIASLRPSTHAYHLLTLPTMSYLGKISYSLYLWHWSVICLSRWTIGLSWWLAPVLFSVMIALAAASYHFLEVPLRRFKWSRSQPRSFVYGLTALSGVAAVILLLLGPGSKSLFVGTSEEVEALATHNQMALRPTKGTLLILGGQSRRAIRRTGGGCVGKISAAPFRYHQQQRCHRISRSDCVHASRRADVKKVLEQYCGSGFAGRTGGCCSQSA